MKKHKKISKKAIIISIISTVVISVVATLIFIFAISPNIVVDECANPCPRNYDYKCTMMGCARVTLFDIITGQY